ncbi:MAG: Bax inhibitor-1/YccA family protein [Lachnospiraceae bacterium]|nr:Bax inhibitor-1/YccA family protein [Lachnospiraceae bacterium]
MDYNQNNTQGYTTGNDGFGPMQYDNGGFSNTTYQNYDDMAGGFESGNAVQTPITKLKSLMFEEVIAKSFLFMVAALVITAFAAFTAPYYMLKWLMAGSFNLYILFGAELAIVLISNWALKKNNAILAGVLYTVYSYLTGATLGIIFLAYTGTSIAAVFLMTAGMFGVMAIYGLVTQRDLSSFSSILVMGLVGIIIASLVNLLLLHSGALEFIISIVGVLIFVGLTAYDTQKIKERVAIANEGNVLTLALAGAFELYLDFINLFLKLLRLFGKRK